MSEPPSVSFFGVPPAAGMMYNSHGPRSVTPWQKTIDFAVGAEPPVTLHAAEIGDEAVLLAVGIDRADVRFGLVDEPLAVGRPVRLAGRSLS